MADQYTFNITSKKCSFDQCRYECKQMGGDLITTSMKPQGIRYHELVDKSEVLTEKI